MYASTYLVKFLINLCHERYFKIIIDNVYKAFSLLFV